MGGQAAEQIIAGVVLSERLAVTTYGAIHRAQFNGQRNLRGLVIDAKFLEDDQFRRTITDADVVDSVTQLDHPGVVPTFTVESNGPDVVVVTRGVGRYVTVADLIMSSKARRSGSPGGAGKLATPVAGLIAKSVVEALAHAHQKGVVHGAVHPRSVIVDEDGAIRLDNFVSGRALTAAIAAGADSALWRGHGGYVAPELVVGEDPTPGTDVFAVGALMFAMMTGEAPPGTLRATPAVERLVQRALDTDAKRRYRSATELLENLIEALEDDRWDLADRGELIREAGLLAGETNIDDATEDLLASLGSAAVSVTPTRPSMDMRAAASVARQKSPGQATGGRLDSLLADLDDHTGVDDSPFRRDPVSELISLDPRKREVIVSATRVPSLDDPDDDTPLPPAMPEHDSGPRNRTNSPTVPARPASSDEAAAFAAIGELDHGVKRVSTAAEQATVAAAKLEKAAARAEQAAKRVGETGQAAAVEKRSSRPAEPILTDDLPTPKLKSPLRGVFGGLLVIAILGAAGYGVYTRFQADDAQAIAAKEQKQRAEDEAAAKTAKARDAQPDPGALEINADGAGIWLRLGRTPLDTPIRLPASQQHDLVLMHDGNEPTEAQINGTTWTGAKDKLNAKLSVSLKPGRSSRAPVMPLQPTSQVLGTTGIVGEGYVHVDSTPSDAEVWLFLGANHARIDNLVAGRDYEVTVVKPGFKTQLVEIKADDWRDGDPGTPIDSAKKKAVLSRDVELVPDPTKKAK
ncbi:MAG TPA: protein kinase [Kofleriaceae bacterium]